MAFLPQAIGIVQSSNAIVTTTGLGQSRLIDDKNA